MSSSLRSAKRKCARSEETGLPVAAVPPVATPGAAEEPVLNGDVLCQVAFHACPEVPRVRVVCKAWNSYITRPDIVAQFDAFTKWETAVYAFKLRHKYLQCPTCRLVMSPKKNIEAWTKLNGWPSPLPPGVAMPSVDSPRIVKLLKYLNDHGMCCLVSLESLCGLLNGQTIGEVLCRCTLPSLPPPPSSVKGPSPAERLVSCLSDLFPNAIVAGLRGTLTLPVSELGGVLKVHFKCLRLGNSTWVYDRVGVDIHTVLIRSKGKLAGSTDIARRMQMMPSSNYSTERVLAAPEPTSLLSYIAGIILSEFVYRNRNLRCSEGHLGPVNGFLHTKTPSQAVKWMKKFKLGPYELE